GGDARAESGSEHVSVEAAAGTDTAGGAAHSLVPAGEPAGTGVDLVHSNVAKVYKFYSATKNNIQVDRRKVLPMSRLLRVAVPGLGFVISCVAASGLAAQEGRGAAEGRGGGGRGGPPAARQEPQRSTRMTWPGLLWREDWKSDPNAPN